MSQYTGTCSEVFFQNTTDYTAKASFTSHASFMAGGANMRPKIWAGHFLNPGNGFAKKVRLRAQGIIGSNGTPTFAFCVLLSTADGADVTGTVIAASAAITMQSSVTACRWDMVVDMVATIPGGGDGNLTLQVNGSIKCPTGFAANYEYPMLPGTAGSGGDSATWTVSSALNGDVTMYPKLSAICSASHASNSITMKSLSLEGLN